MVLGHGLAWWARSVRRLLGLNEWARERMGGDEGREGTGKTAQDLGDCGEDLGFGSE